jgi:hypothetical protein
VHALAGRRLDRVLDQIDQHLLDLIAVDFDEDLRPAVDRDLVAVKRRRALQDIGQVRLAKTRRRQTGQPGDERTKLLRPQRLHRIDRRGAPRRHIARQQRDPE